MAEFFWLLKFANSSDFPPWMSAVAFVVGNLKTICPDQIFLVNFSCQRHDKFIKNEKWKKNFPIPENPLTTKVGQRKLGGYKIAVFMSNCCFFSTFEEVCFWKKIVHQI